jgi:hypothetical protein
MLPPHTDQREEKKKEKVVILLPSQPEWNLSLVFHLSEIRCSSSVNEAFFSISLF